MALRFFGFAVLGLAVAAWAQQGTGTDSGSAKPPATSAPQSSSSGQSSPNQSSSGQGSPSQGSDAKSDSPSHPAAQPHASELSRDLTFPEDEPAKTPAPASGSPKAPNLAPPRSDRVQADDLGSGGESSSKDTAIDLSPPEDDAKVHPKSSTAVAEAETGLSSGGITELHTWDPHKAAKSIEVGDFYFRRKNYRAAEERYREALRYKENDAVATLRLAIALEKLGVLDDARSEYESYLKILPHGPEAEQAQKALVRLNAQASGSKPQ
jgi:tetratricopeptide (TPR) repeat protein